MHNHTALNWIHEQAGLLKTHAQMGCAPATITTVSSSTLQKSLTARPGVSG